MRAPLRYLLWGAAGLVGSLAVCAGFTILVDPYYVFGTPAIAGADLLRPRANDQMIAARSHLAARMRPRTLLLGNSRTEVGFDPASAAWPRSMMPVFDGGLPGMELAAARRVVEAALSGGRLSHIFIAVEFLDTIGDQEHAAPLPPIQTPVTPLRRWLNDARDWFHASLTVGAVADSMATLLNQDPTAVNATRRDGSAELGEYVAYVGRYGGAALFQRKIAEYRTRFANYVPPDFTRPERNATFAALIALLDAAHANQCGTDIIIYPYHAAVLDLLRQRGLWPSFEQFKRALVGIVWHRYPDARVVDFSGYSAFTTEPPPPPGPGGAMRWYWEPGHFRTSLGDRIIDRLYREATGFGRDLTPDTIDAALAGIRRERDERLAEAHAPR
jgi:hypothetical protein